MADNQPFQPSSSHLEINQLEYLEMVGLNVMLAHDYYPESHQGGVGVIQNGLRVATNGDLRLEPMPGQWSPVPAVGKRLVDRDRNEISVRMAYPDETKNKKGFNPIDYPDFHFAYTLKIRPEGKAFRILVDLDEPLPEAWVGKVGFNLELFPGTLFGKSFLAASGVGVFPRQAQGEGRLGVGRQIIIAPDTETQRMEVLALSAGELELLDGRLEHNNGWFVLRSLVAAEVTKNAIDWLVTPHPIPNWKCEPVIQVSQVGYHPEQPKVAVIELDATEETIYPIQIVRINEIGDRVPVLTREPSLWGRFLRYQYVLVDFTSVKAPGLYRVVYGQEVSHPFRISPDIFSSGVWQPTLEYFLPVQMCHMRVTENYRVWHGACHLDDARMAPTDFNFIDGYHQGSSTLTSYAPNQHVPGLDCGGWHDAGDYDLRVESQADTVHGLALAYEEFGLNYDNTTIDQDTREVQLLCPDGKPDILQQVEHGCLSIVGGYRSLGRLYRGLIEPTLHQYTHLGDAATVTDNIPESGDDRWVFTEQNPYRELGVAGSLAAASRVLRGFNESLASDCLQIATELYDRTEETDPLHRIEAALELFLATHDSMYSQFLVEQQDAWVENIERLGWLAARALGVIEDDQFIGKVVVGLRELRNQTVEKEKRTPYGLPYEPDIWGAGWGIQRFGVEQYWLHKARPDIFPADFMLHAVNFILGCHPGPNTASFVSGVGVKSLIPGYGVNRAEFSYIPGGIGSGTALIRPDFPELLEWPYLWQQTEYCMGYATSDYIFLIAAADAVLNSGR